MTDRNTYPPLDCLKPVAPGVWIVDGPAVAFGVGWMKAPFPTRMTIVRLGDGTLFVHSPTALTPALRLDLAGLGAPSCIVAPNRLHYSWVAPWHDAYPQAAVYLAPRIVEQAKGRLDVPHRDLAADGGYPWDGEIDTLAVAGSYMTEFEFFHRASRTLILTDLIESFESRKLGLLMRLLTGLGGVRAPRGGMPRDMRLTFSRAVLKRAVETMIAWDPQRVVISHGRWFEAGGADALRNALRSVLR